MAGSNETRVAHAPEEWPRRFTECLAAGDVAGLVALYAEDACFVTPSGETLVGRDRVAPVLVDLVARQARMRSNVVRAVTLGDVAVLYTDFEGTARDPSGRPVELESRAIEVLRRAPDGAWRLILGDPNARAG